MSADHHPRVVTRTFTVGAVNYPALAQKIEIMPSDLSAVNDLRDALDDLRHDPRWCDLATFQAIARNFAQVQLDPALTAADSPLRASCDEVHRYVGQTWNPERNEYEDSGDESAKRKIYGVNTGFGSFRQFYFEGADKPGILSFNILLSHAVGTGRPLPVEVARGMMLLRLRTFAQSVSGVRPILLEKLVAMLNRGVIPYIPEKGSLGSSGDLAPLAHLFKVLIGRGKAWVIDRSWILEHPFEATQLFDDDHDGRELALNPEETSESRCRRWGSDRAVLLTGAEAMRLADIEPLSEDDLTLKDGLALTNGATMSAAVLALAVQDAEQLWHSANRSGALTLQSIGGLTRAMENATHSVRPQLGQILTGRTMIRLLRGSTFINRSAYLDEAQDDYCVRAIPQVHGACLDAILYARSVAELEINAVTDNPLFFGEFLHRAGIDFNLGVAHLNPEKVRFTAATTHCSAAQFHGEPVALALDFLKIAVAEIANITERRIQMLYDSHHNRGLPANLTPGALGLHTGFMIYQYTAASLVAENKVLCHPSSVDSIPSSANAEDHVSMATNAARHTRMVLRNAFNVIAIETLSALQAVDLRAHHTEWLRRLTDAAYQRYLEHCETSATPMSWENFCRTLDCFTYPALEFAERDGYPASPDALLDTSMLKLSPATQKVYDALRKQAGIPFIVGDSHKGDSAPTGATFADYEADELTARIAVLLRDAPEWFE